MPYYNLLTSYKLDNYLTDVDESAKNLFKQAVKSLAEKVQITENLIVENMMLWVQNLILFIRLEYTILASRPLG